MKIKIDLSKDWAEALMMQRDEKTHQAAVEGAVREGILMNVHSIVQVCIDDIFEHKTMSEQQKLEALTDIYDTALEWLYQNEEKHGLDQLMDQEINACHDAGCTKTRISQCWALENINPGESKNIEHRIPEGLCGTCPRGF